MKVILQQNVANLGKVGDQVNVKPGFARNFLLPQQKASLATPANIADFEHRRVELEKAAQDQIEVAKVRAAELAKLSLTMESLASDEGKLFGSIGPREVAEVVVAAGVEISKSEVVMPEGPIRMTGEHQVTIKLHPEVSIDVQIEVSAKAAT